MQESARYDEKLASILRQSASVFAEKGYDGASIRDISSATGVSLSGLYYYFDSKEELLFLIQHHCFETILERVRAELEHSADPEERLRRLIWTHLRFFADNMHEMKVLSHEAAALTGDYRARVTEQKRAYAEVAAEVLRELSPNSTLDLRSTTFSLFGMLNWIYTWYRPGRDVPVDRLAMEMTHILMYGVLAKESPPTQAGPSQPDSDKAVSIWRAP